MQHAGPNARRTGVGLPHVANNNSGVDGVMVEGRRSMAVVAVVMAVGGRWVVAMTKEFQELGGRVFAKFEVQGFLRAVARPRDGAGGRSGRWRQGR